MVPRLIWAIISILLEETALAVVVLVWLPTLDIHVPLPVLIVVMVLWLVVAVLTYQAGTRALKRKQVAGLPDMIGTQGEVVTPLTPEGMIRIKGELWVAKSAGGEIESGAEVIVVGQDGLKLVVKAKNNG